MSVYVSDQVVCQSCWDSCQRGRQWYLLRVPIIEALTASKRCTAGCCAPLFCLYQVRNCTVEHVPHISDQLVFNGSEPQEDLMR